MIKDQVAYVAHPVAPDEHMTLEQNVEDTLITAREIQFNNDNPYLPVVPWLPNVLYADDGNPYEREVGIQMDVDLIKRGHYDVLLLTGHKLSTGMKAEAIAFWEMDKGVVAYHPNLQKPLEQFAWDYMTRCED